MCYVMESFVIKGKKSVLWMESFVIKVCVM